MKIALSHPVWVRGLKQMVTYMADETKAVAPRVGAWIETYPASYATHGERYRRTPCGCVD